MSKKPRRDAPLTAQEKAVLRLLMDFHGDYQKIAAALVITVFTVKTHINNLFLKLEVNSKLGLVLAAIERGLLSPPGMQRKDFETMVEERVNAEIRRRLDNGLFSEQTQKALTDYLTSL